MCTEPLMYQKGIPVVSVVKQWNEAEAPSTTVTFSGPCAIICDTPIESFKGGQKLGVTFSDMKWRGGGGGGGGDNHAA